MPAIWFNKQLNLDDLQHLGSNTIADHIGIRFIEIGDDYIKATMPVDDRTKQPYGLLHGGASAVLAETLGSVGSAYVVDHNRFMCVGIEINANHLRSAKQGVVTGIATPIHLGGKIHVWDIKIYDEASKLICVSRLTVSILPRGKQVSGS